MTRDDITFYLACWGAGLSTIKAVFDTVKGIRDVKSGLIVSAQVSHNKESIDVKIVNKSARPLTILKYDFTYSASEEMFQLVKSYELQEPIKLLESEVRKIEVPVSDLRQAAIESAVAQRFYHRLFIRVWTTNLGVVHQVVNTYRDIEEISASTGLEFILTDRLLGLPEMKPIIHRRSGSTLK